MSEKQCVSKEIAGRVLTLETGQIARQANGAVIAKYGETVVLASACISAKTREGLDFFPLTVDYRESRYAAGKFPGGFFKREGRPSEKETLTSRCIDRPIRPLFPDGLKNEVQILLNVISFDQENESDVCGMVAAFAALAISDIPFQGRLGSVRIGHNDGQLVVNPTLSQISEGVLNLIITGSDNAIMMVEGGADEQPESVILEALALAQTVIKDICDLIQELQQKCGKPKQEFVPPVVNEPLEKAVREAAYERLQQANVILDKHQRQSELDTIGQETTNHILTEMKNARQAAIERGEVSASDVEAYLEYAQERSQVEKEIKQIFHDLEKEIMRLRIVKERLRSDNRKTNEIRPISSEVGLIPRTHGSALFTRGQTQALVITTLGTLADEQKVDGIAEEYYKKFMLHYNFPPYCVGETRPLRGPGRREIGHGALAERALRPMLLQSDEFPYTIRLVSEITESNGSSSMASVCGGSLALMDAGVPLRSAVAGIAMGLIAEGDEYAILSDILGVEDHLGDMDFKVTGTRKGITAFQMDLKIEGITQAIMAEALEQARQGREHILNRMEETLSQSREEISPLAPKIQTFIIPVEKIRDVIGPGGKMIRKIIAETGAKIDIEDDGKVTIASVEGESGKKAREWVEYLTKEVEIGTLYKGKVTRIVNFGAFVEVLPGQEGLVHISHLAEGRVNAVEDVLKEGDEIDVKVIEVDDLGRINLSKRDADRDLGRTALKDQIGGDTSRGDRGDRGGRGDKDRGGRGGNRGGGGGRSGGGGGRGGGRRS